MNEEEKLLYVEALFTDVFKRPVDQSKLYFLLKKFGHDRLIDVLEYYMISPPAPPKEGKHDNPYGLLYIVATKFTN